MTVPPVRLYFTALERRLSTTWLKRCRSARTVSVPVLPTQRPTRTLRSAAKGWMSEAASLQTAETETASRTQLDLAALDAGNVEHLVDEAQQVPAPFEDVRDLLALAVCWHIQFQELPEAQNRVERRAQFMAHAREELALGAVGMFRFGLRFFGCVLRLEQRLLGLFTHGDVGKGNHRAPDLPVFDDG